MLASIMDGNDDGMDGQQDDKSTMSGNTVTCTKSNDEVENAGTSVVVGNVEGVEIPSPAGDSASNLDCESFLLTMDEVGDIRRSANANDVEGSGTSMITDAIRTPQTEMESMDSYHKDDEITNDTLQKAVNGDETLKIRDVVEISETETTAMDVKLSSEKEFEVVNEHEVIYHDEPGEIMINNTVEVDEVTNVAIIDMNTSGTEIADHVNCSSESVLANPGIMDANYENGDDNALELDQILSHEIERDMNTSGMEIADQVDCNIEDVQGIDVICGNCGQHFHSLSTLSSHLSTHHGSNLNSVTSTSIEVLQDEEDPKDESNENAVSTNNFNLSTVEKYQCHYCWKEFLSRRLLLRHTRICEVTSDFSLTKRHPIMNQLSDDKVAVIPLQKETISSLTCKLCNRIFTNQSSLRAHVRDQHENDLDDDNDHTESLDDFDISDVDSEYKIIDDITEKTSSKRGTLKVTIGQKSRGENRRKLPNILSDYSDSDEEDYCRSTNPIADRTCKYCSKVLSRPSNMRKHVRNIHENPMKMHHDTETAAMDDASKRRQNRDTSDVQIQSVKRKIEQRDKDVVEPFPTQSTTKTHKLAKMHDVSPPSSPDIVDETWGIGPIESRTCKYCRKILSRPSNMRKHVRNVHEKPAKLQESANLLSQENDELEEVSDKNHGKENQLTKRKSDFSAKYEMKKEKPVERQNGASLDHTVVLNGNRNNKDRGTVVVITNNKNPIRNVYRKMRQCPECFRILSSPHSLMEHMRTHTGEKPFVCERCGRPFSTPRNLKKHMISVHSGTKAYKCNDCGKEFALKSSLKAHSKFHTGTFQYHCSGCGKGFQTPASLKRHELIHTGERPYPCEQCGKRFNDLSALKKHVFFHTGLKPHVCEKCGHSFATLSSLRYHDLVHTGVSAFQCHECGRNYRTNSSLQRHQRIHSGEKPYVCDFCGEAFGERWQLISHHRGHTGERPFACPQCDKTFVSLRKLTRHSHTHNPAHLCTYCGKSFTTSSFLKTHMYRHTGEHPFHCTQCPKRFSTRSSLKRHEVTHSGIKPYICDFCGKCFSSAMGLKNHVTLHTGDRPHVCETCGKGFPNKTALRIHSQFHNAEKRYQCDQCSRRFHRVYELNHHRLTHSNEKSFKCDKCDKSYHHKSALLAHINTHTGEKWYPCNECDKSFLRQATLRKHKKIHVAIKPYLCSECGRRFVRKEHLRRHQATHSNLVAAKAERVIVQDITELEETLTSDDNIMNLEETSMVAEHVEMDLSESD